MALAAIVICGYMILSLASGKVAVMARSAIVRNSLVVKLGTCESNGVVTDGTIFIRRNMSVWFSGSISSVVT